ncbi:MAG TPA: GNAT family N-acetyltransferase, partial [Thermoanaerobaculia bacterium]
MIQIRSLAGVGFETMTAAFNDAFSDYDIPAKYTTEYLTNLVIRRGYRPDLAVGAFDGNRLVGFVFNCLDGDAAYNSGTGVAISHRRQGIARRLMQRSIETLPARRYILEVIDTNTRAAALYRELGFVETRQLQSWRFTRSECGALAPPSRRRQAAALQRLRSWCDMTPSWQNDVASILRASEPYLILGDEDAGAVVFPSNGDVPILAVRPAARRRGKGRALLAEVARSVGKPLRIMNVEDRFEGFLEHCGAEKFVRQLEM